MFAESSSLPESDSESGADRRSNGIVLEPSTPTVLRIQKVAAVHGPRGRRIKKVTHKYPPYPMRSKPGGVMWVNGHEERSTCRVDDEESWKRACSAMKLRECSVKIVRTQSCDKLAQILNEDVNSGGGFLEGNASNDVVSKLPVRESAGMTAAITKKTTMPRLVSNSLTHVLPSSNYQSRHPPIYTDYSPVQSHSGLIQVTQPMTPIADGLRPQGASARKTHKPMPVASPLPKRPRVYVYRATKYGVTVRESSVTLRNVFLGFPPEFKRKIELEGGRVQIVPHPLTPDGSFSDGCYVGYSGRPMRDINCDWMGRSVASKQRDIVKETSVPPDLLVPLTNLSVTTTSLSFAPEMSMNGNDLPNASFPNQHRYAQVAFPTSNTLTAAKKPPYKVVLGYTLFASEVRKDVAAKNPDASFGEVSRMVGNMWRSLSVFKKAEYENRAADMNKISAMQYEAVNKRSGDAFAVGSTVDGNGVVFYPHISPSGSPHVSSISPLLQNPNYSVTTSMVNSSPSWMTKANILGRQTTGQIRPMQISHGPPSSNVTVRNLRPMSYGFPGQTVPRSTSPLRIITPKAPQPQPSLAPKWYSDPIPPDASNASTSTQSVPTSPEQPSSSASDPAVRQRGRIMIVPMNRLIGASDDPKTAPSGPPAPINVVEKLDGFAAFQPEAVDEDPLNSEASSADVIDLE